ncbi:unnamed protein product [Durusdinium trenchii]|uniref:Fungal lipase-type domain-containing protein n=2 Tax=Durusdinium trenchii TaxID=1381693 RepID=A0ABP0IHY4_9DINO
MLRVWRYFLLAIVSAINSCQPDPEQETHDAAILLQSAMTQNDTINTTDGFVFEVAAISAMIAAAVKLAGTVHSSHSSSWNMAMNDPNFWSWGEHARADFERLLPATVELQRHVGMFTIGSPGPFRPAPRNLQSADGCFRGIRLAAKEAWALGFTPIRRRDPVPAVAGLMKYEHPPMDVMLLNTGTKGDIEMTEMQPCGHWDWRTTVPAYAGVSGSYLHITKHYARGLENLKNWAHESERCVDGWHRPSDCATQCVDGWTGDYCYTAAGKSSKCTKCRDSPVRLNTANRWQALGKIAIDVSYLDASSPHDRQAVSQRLPHGYHVEGYAHAKSYTTLVASQSSWLLKNQEGNCVVTFAGTDSWEDWFQDAQVNPTAFCGFLDEKDKEGLQNGHTFTFWGFKYHLLRMVESPEFQTNIRSKLQHCTSVDAVGHSLGGAMAILFSMCIHNAPKPGQAGYADYAAMGFASG